MFDLSRRSGECNAPTGYGLPEPPPSQSSRTAACRTKIERRDKFLGVQRCVVCGEKNGLELCHIIRPSASDLKIWHDLKHNRWIPSEARSPPAHEPRNGMLMCPDHCRLFDGHYFFIRFLPKVGKFVFVNFSNHPDLRPFHGKAIALDANDPYAPFPTLFIIHEMRVRGFHPFELVHPAMPIDILWQDWMLLDGVFENRYRPVKLQLLESYEDSGSPDDPNALPLNEGVINDCLAATHAPKIGVEGSSSA